MCLLFRAGKESDLVLRVNMNTKRIGTILIALMLAFTGCTNNESNVSEENNITDTSIAVSEDELPGNIITEAIVTENITTEEDELNESDLFRWDNMNLNIESSKRKLVISDTDSFEEDFISQYVDYIPDGREILSISEYSITEYSVEANTIYVIKAPREDGELVTCIYVDNKVAVACDSYILEMTNYPVEGDTDYRFTTVEYEDYTVVSYEDSIDSFTDAGTRYYDADGHLIVWEYYCASGSRQIYILWQEDGIHTIIDTGGAAFTNDEEDPEVSNGIYTVIYTFSEPVSFEELGF